MTETAIATLRLQDNRGSATFDGAHLQSPAGLARRRAIMAALVLASIAGIAWIFGGILSRGGWTVTEAVIFSVLLVCLPWKMLGFWNAVIGFWLLRRGQTGLDAVAPYLTAATSEAPLRLRCAVLMTIRNEDPARAFKRLRIMHESLAATGEASAFDFFVLSDTSKPEIAAEEERLFAAWQAGLDGKVFYRRRTSNEGFKAGNLRDFLERHGQDYELMLTLDADSLMSGEAILSLGRIMQAHPEIGILQTLVTGAPTQSGFARLFQFGMRHGMRSYTMGHAWWTGDYGPYWGHNAMIRTKPFARHCALPELPGRPPFGGPVLSHDHIEAAMMRHAGYEVRVVPVEGGSYEDNPPTLIDFLDRDLRWCQGVMQYWQLLFLPSWQPMSRLLIGMTSMLYVSSSAWLLTLILAVILALLQGSAATGALGIGLLCLYMVSLMPRLAGLMSVMLEKGGTTHFGGTMRFLAGGMGEIVFSLLLAPIAMFKTTLFMAGAPFGWLVTWGGQQRDPHGLSLAAAARAFWPQTLIGLALLGALATRQPEALIWAAPLLSGLAFAIPFAMLTASPRFGRWLARKKFGAIPEEISVPSELHALAARP